MGERHCEPTRRVWWIVRAGRYQVQVRYGARIVQTERGVGSRRTATEVARQLAEKHRAVEICEGD